MKISQIQNVDMHMYRKSYRFYIKYLLFSVRLLVEIIEQEEEQNGVHSNPPDEGTRIVTVNK